MPDIKTLKAMENKVLTSFSQGYAAPNYVNRIVCPPIPVTRSRGEYMVSKNGLIIYDTERAPRAKSKTVDFDFGTDSYTTRDHWLSVLLDKREIDEAEATGLAAVMALKQESIAFVLSLLEAKREKDTADRVMGAGYYHNDFKTDINATPWSDQTDGDPIGDIMAGMKAVRSMGVNPNALVMSVNVYNALSVHPALTTHFKNQSGLLSEAEIMGLFRGIKKIVVADGMYNAGTPDAPVLTPFWGDHCAIVPIHTLQEMKTGARVHTAMFDLLKNYKSFEHDEGETIRMIQAVEWGLLSISNQHGYLIQNAVAGS